MKQLKNFVVALVIMAIFAASICGCSGSEKENSSGKKGASKTATETVVISIDEWIGYWGLLIANGGLETAPDSINAKNGISVKYVIMNDPSMSSSALISGEIQGAGYTVNRYSFLQNKFDEAGIKVIMPFITNFSNGADGIISKADIRNVSDLVGKKVAVPRFSESQTLVEWLINNSDLTTEERSQIRKDMVFFETADETAKAFFSGEVDAAATWEPYLTEAASATESRILFSTAMAKNLILSGIIFRTDFVEQNEDFIVKLMDGAFEARPQYKKDFDTIRQMPMCEIMTEEEIVAMADGADLTTAAQNANILQTSAVQMYKDMANVWLTIGETAYPDKAETAFTDKYAIQLLDKYPEEGETETSKLSGEEKKKLMESPDALLDYKADIKFELNSTDIKEESYSTLDDFVDVAKVLDGVYIQIEGNTSQRNEGVTEAEIKQFSKERAESVANYFINKGISKERIMVVGNGDSKLLDPENPAGAVNRRTEIYFKTTMGF